MDKLILSVLIFIATFLTGPILFILFGDAFEAWVEIIKNIFG